MTEMEDDLILESVTYFKYPSSTNVCTCLIPVSCTSFGPQFANLFILQENEMSFDHQKVKEETESSTEAYESNDYPPPAENYPFNYSPYFPHQNQVRLFCFALDERKYMYFY